MSQIKSNLPSIYNPANQSKSEIISNFVVRLNEFNELFSAVKRDKMKYSPQHFLIQGQRGYGKTTLLLRLKYEIEKNNELKKWLLPIMFDEEQYRVNTLAKLWEEVIDILEYQHKNFEGVSNKIESLYNSDSPEENIFKLLTSALKKKNKKIILLFDNFGDIIDKFRTKEKQRLREVLMTSNQIRIIGASSKVLEFTHNYKEPFFDFFKVITLEELNRKETLSLLKKLSMTYKGNNINKVIKEQPERIEALRRLTGSVPRTIVLLFEIFIDESDGDSFKDLEKILDGVTPLYKQRLDNLSTNQQTIIDAIAQNWDAISTGDIAKKVRMQSKTVSAQLKQLETNQLIKKIPTSTKNYLYQIRERFFNIYYLMRLGNKKNKNKVLWLVRFFEIWCSEKELEERAKCHIEIMKKNKPYEKYAYFISHALSRTHIPIELQDKLIKQTRNYLTTIHSNFTKDLDKTTKEILKEAKVLLQKNKLTSAYNLLINERFSEEYIGLFFADYFYLEKKDFKNAIKYTKIAIEKGNQIAMNNLAFLYESEFKDFKKAEKYYLMAVKNKLTVAMNNLAFLYESKFTNFKKAEKYYLMAVENGVAESMNNLALLYESEFKDFKKAEKYYLMAVKEKNVTAMFNLALLNEDEFKDFKKVEKYYLMAVKNGNAKAMNNLALLYEDEFKDFKKAEKYYLMAVKKVDVKAMNNLALLYESEFKDFKKAEKYYLMAVKKGHTDSMNNLALLYFILIKKNEEALLLSKNSLKNKKHHYYSITYIIILLWNNKISQAIKTYNKFLQKESLLIEIDSYFQLLLLMFLAKKQYHFIFNLFKENKYDIKDKYKPIYYAVLSLMGKKYEDELKKMGDELKETVDEILEEVKQIEKDYK